MAVADVCRLLVALCCAIAATTGQRVPPPGRPCPPGLTGARCDDRCPLPCPHACHRHTGHCLDTTTGVPDACESSPCHNGGSCDNRISTFVCRCAPGYAGRTCDIATGVPDACESSPCHNGGSCDNRISTFVCRCAPGYAGRTCDIDSSQATNATCNGQQIVTEPTVIESPGYPLHYPNNLNCSWLVRAPHSGLHASIIITNFSLQLDYDSLGVYAVRAGEPAHLASNLTGSFCNLGMSAPSGYDLLLHFTTDHNDTSHGFNIIVEFTEAAIYLPPTSCNGSGCSSLGETLREPGRISSPNYPDNYPNNARCTWFLVAPDASIFVLIHFHEFDLELRYDFVYVYHHDASVLNTSAVPDAVLTGLRDYFTYHVPSSAATLRFVSDGSVVRKGFSAVFNFTYEAPTSTALPPSTTTRFPGYQDANCSVAGLHLTASAESSGELASPIYPGQYPNNADCRWVITADNSTEDINRPIVHVHIDALVLETSFDNLYLFDGPNLSSPLIAALTGYANTALHYYSTGPHMLLRFRTDGSVVANGFHASYDSLKGCEVGYWGVSNCSSACPPACNHTGCSVESGECPGSGTSEPLVTTLTYDNQTCSNQGINITQATQIASPGYPGEYLNHVDCVWFVVAPQGLYMEIVFLDVSLEVNFDFVKVFDGVETQWSRPAFIVNGIGSNMRYKSNTNVTTVWFKTDGSVTRTGFIANITFTDVPPSDNQTTWAYGLTTPRPVDPICQAQGIRVGGTNGTISTPGYPGTYYNLADCLWLLEPPTADMLVRITFTFFNTERGYDFAYITDGAPGSGGENSTTGAAPQYLAHLHGDLDTPLTYNSTGPGLSVRFTSDGSVTRQGFLLRYHYLHPEI